jgi:protein SCO1
VKPTTVAAVVLVGVAWGVACHSNPAPPTRRFDLQGTILAVNRGSGNIVVRHGDIPGYMSAMTMPYAVGRSENITFLETGDEIRAEVVVTIEGAAHLEHITVVRHAKTAPR